MSERNDRLADFGSLIRSEGGRIVYVVIDGLGGLFHAGKGCSELQAASLPNLDALAGDASSGFIEIVGPGITPGSGPGHLALFGYDPLRFLVGRGVLSALGIDFELRDGDVAARVNFATVDEDGNVTDRRAGRIGTDLNRELCEAIRSGIDLDFDGEVFFETVSEHRAVLVLRGEGLSGELDDVDPQETGVPPREPSGRDEASERTAALVRQFLEQVREILRDREPANMVLLRGFERYGAFPSFRDRTGLRACCLADYPMYRGLSRLLGFDVPAVSHDLEERFRNFRDRYASSDEHDFFFLHVKDPDKYGENGDFDGKVAALEAIDRVMPIVVGAEPDVLVVTGDHSTPAALGKHSWHPVPVLLRSPWTHGQGNAAFDELGCARGLLGLRPAVDLIWLALAHAGRLRKYGA